jgi:hypothetical protein
MEVRDSDSNFDSVDHRNCTESYQLHGARPNHNVGSIQKQTEKGTFTGSLFRLAITKSRNCLGEKIVLSRDNQSSIINLNNLIP